MVNKENLKRISFTGTNYVVVMLPRLFLEEDGRYGMFSLSTAGRSVAVDPCLVGQFVNLSPSSTYFQVATQ